MGEHHVFVWEDADKARGGLSSYMLRQYRLSTALLGCLITVASWLTISYFSGIPARVISVIGTMVASQLTAVVAQRATGRLCSSFMHPRTSTSRQLRPPTVVTAEKSGGPSPPPLRPHRLGATSPTKSAFCWRPFARTTAAAAAAARVSSPSTARPFARAAAPTGKDKPSRGTTLATAHINSSSSSSSSSGGMASSSPSEATGGGIGAQDPTGVIVVLTTVPSEGVGERLGGSLVEGKLAACVNMVPRLTSIYEWEGAVHVDSELLLIIKTRMSLLTELTAYIKAHHPYKECEVIALPVLGGSASYLQWVLSSTKERAAA